MESWGPVIEIDFRENTIKIKLRREAALQLQKHCYKGKEVCVIDYLPK